MAPQTYMAPHGQIYVNEQPMSPDDVVIPNRPENMSIHSMFDKDRWIWFDPMTDPVFLKKQKIREILVKYEHEFEHINLVYPPHEREGWSLQITEAERWLDDNEYETPMIDLLLTVRDRNESKEDFVNSIMEKSNQFKQLYAWLTGQQQKMYNEVILIPDDEQHYEEIRDYVVEYLPIPTSQ